MMRPAALLLSLAFVLASCTGGDTAETTTSTDVTPTTGQPSTTPTSPTTLSETTTDVVDTGALTLLTPEPVVEPLADASYVNPGWTIYHDGTWYMFRNSFSAWPGASNVSLMTSADGVEWVEAGDEPLFASDQVEFTNGNVFFMTGYIDAEGTWISYFYTYDGANADGSIGRATAPSPEGPWTSDSEPVVVPGQASQWDGRRVIEPSVVQTGDGLLMWFTGFSRNGESQIGLATSDDGISWTKHDDPETTDPRLDESDPVYAADQDWAEGEIDCPEVTVASDGYIMHLGSSARSNFASGLATSPDGINWTSWSDNPLVTQEITPGGEQFWQSALEYVDETLWLFLEVGPGATDTDIYAYQIDMESAE